MEYWKVTMSEQETRSTRLQSTQLCNAKTFAQELKLRQAAPQVDDSFIGAEDHAISNHSLIDGCLSAAGTSQNVISFQRVIEMGDVYTLEEALTSREAYPEMCNAFGETLLHTAVLHHQQKAVQLLLNHGASPLTKLQGKNYLQASEATLESTALQNFDFWYSYMLDSAEATSLHYACAVGQLDVLKLLLSVVSPSNNSFKHSRPGSLLLWAITCGHSDVVEFLVLKSHLEADCFDKDGNNSVAIAVLVLESSETPTQLKTLKTIIQSLLKRDRTDGGADVNHKNMQGLTAFDVAKTPATKQILAQFGALTARILSVEQVLRWNRDQY